MSFPRYQKYKDSGVEWLGEVPEYWAIEALKTSFKIVGGSTPKSEMEEFWEGDICWATPADLSGRSSVYLADTQRKITLAGLQSCAATVVPKNSIVLSTRAPIGSLAITTCAMCTNQGCRSLVPSEKSNARYFAYFLGVSTEQLNLRGKGTTFLELSAEALGAFKTPIPPQSEQRAIANFLDKETRKLDALLGEQQRLIALLKEKRRTVISHAITKGLNADAEMKPSGVEWLGDVPSHWSISAIKWLSPVQRGASPRPIDDLKYFDDDGMYAWVRISDVSASNGTLLTTTQRLSDLGASLSVQIAPGELFVSIAGTVGKPCISGIHACIHDGFVYFPRLKMDNRYLFRVFEAGDCYGGLGKWGTQLNLNTDTIGSIRVATPPSDEMVQILSFIEQKTREMETLVCEAERAIDLLQEHRTALIAAAVTGKIDVLHLADAEAA